MNYYDRITAEITINDFGELLPATDFALYILYFRDVYSIIEKAGPSLLNWVNAAGDMERFYLSVWENVPPETAFYALKPYPPSRYSMDSIWPEDRGERDSLMIGRISRNSPLELTFYGISIAITTAVILSGGEIEVTKQGIKCKLRPIGEGIKILREALRRKLR